MTTHAESLHPDLKGKVALVTGAGSGLGRACARLFAREGARVVVMEVRREPGEETAQLIRDAGGEARTVVADVSKSVDVQRAVDDAVEAYGGLDCAVNNAVHFMQRQSLADIAEADWDKALAVNLTGVFLCMKYEIRAMLKRGAGAIVNVGSGNEHSAVPGLSWYLGAKQGMYGITKAAALEYAPQGIRINALGPGSMWTPALKRVAEQQPDHIDKLKNRTPLRRIAEPEEVAEAAVWLCSAGSSYVLGHTLLAEGGAVLG